MDEEPPRCANAEEEEEELQSSQREVNEMMVGEGAARIYWLQQRPSTRTRLFDLNVAVQGSSKRVLFVDADALPLFSASSLTATWRSTTRPCCRS